MSTAIHPVQVALDTTLIQIPMLAGAKVYNGGSVPQGSPFPYITIGGSTEGPLDLFSSQGGNDGTITLHYWAKDTSAESAKVQVLAIHAAVDALLSDQELPLDGHRMISGKLFWSTDMADPDVKGVHHGVATYNYTTLKS